MVADKFTPISCQSVSLTTTSARNSTDLTGNMVAVWATATSFIKCGGSTITAATTDIAIPANTMVYIPRTDFTRIAGVTASSATLYIITLN